MPDTKKQTPTASESLATIPQIAARLNMSVGAFRTARSNKTIRIPYIKVGGRIRYAPGAVDAYLAEHTVEEV
jgi:hypothetical protein